MRGALAEQESARGGLSTGGRVVMGAAFVLVGLFYLGFRHQVHRFTARLGFAREGIETRRERIAFSEKYYQVPARFVVPASSDLEISPEGMRGVVVGTQRATSFERFLRDKFPDVDLRVYATMDEA